MVEMPKSGDRGDGRQATVAQVVAQKQEKLELKKVGMGTESNERSEST